MGQYKVPQDIEAEDKILGPLSVRQFIYVVIGLGWAGLMWVLFNKIIILMFLLILPITGFFIMLGFGRRQEQSFENYFVAMLQYFLIPRVRVWDKDLSQVELIKKSEVVQEVTPLKNVNPGSLKQLALIMDTHGAQKDPTIQLQDASNQAVNYNQRIINPASVAGAGNNAPTASPRLTEQDDVLDATNARSVEVNDLLENVEANIQQQALQNVQKNLSKAINPVDSKQDISQLKTSGAIIKKAMFQGNNLTIKQIARDANQHVISEGQTVRVPAG